MSFSRSILILLLLTILSLSLIASSVACGPSCQTSYFYLQRPNFNYSSNGCGSYGISVSAPFGANSCCSNHDYCYSNCSTVKTACDSNFDSCLTSQCGTLDSSLDQDACKVQARLFYEAVMGLGCPAYTSAQDSACECSSSNNYSLNSTVYYLGGAAGTVSSGVAQLVALLLVVLTVTAYIL